VDVSFLCTKNVNKRVCVCVCARARAIESIVLLSHFLCIVCDNGTLWAVLQTSFSGMHMNSKVGEQHANYELNTQISICK
jgi:hypothetical protein